MRLREFFEKFSMDDISTELKILAAAFFIYYLAWGVINPFISIYIHRITGIYSGTGFLIGFMFLLQLSVMMPLGDLVDKIGSKIITVFSFFNYMGVGLVYFFANSFVGILVARAWNTFSSSGVWISGVTLAREFSKNDKEAESMAFFNFAWTVSSVIGPLLGILILLLFPLRTVFLLLPICAVVAAAIVHGFVPEAIEKRERIGKGIKDVIFKDRVFAKEFKDLFSKKENIMVAFIHFIRRFNFGVMTMVLALFARELGGELWQVAIIYSIFYIPFMTRIEFGAFADDFGRRKMIGIGTLLSSLVLFNLFMVNSLPIVFVLTLILAIGTSMIAPSVEGIITRIGRGWEGEATGIYQSVGSLAMGTGPIIAGIISDIYSLNHAFLLSGLMFLTVFPVLWKLKL